MANYTSRILSIRIPSDLLEAVRERARADGRSVSGEIVFAVRKQIEIRPVENEKPRPITGWLAHVDVPGKYANFRAGRRQASRKLLGAVRAKARRR
jgi:hypothetical protein